MCGTTFFYTEDDVDDDVFVAVGAFADPGFTPPTISVYDCRRHPWVRLPLGTRVFERDPECVPLLDSTGHTD